MSQLDHALLKDKLKGYNFFWTLINLFRPPSPKCGTAGKTNRERFSSAYDEFHLSSAVVDVGSGPSKDGNTAGLSDKLLKKRVAFDYFHQPGVGLVADVNKLPFQDESVSAVLFQGVIEHIKDPRIAISEIVRVLEPGGLIYVEAPFLQHFHYDPIDYYRYTVDGLEYTLKDFGKIDSGVLYGPSAVLVDVLTEYFAVVFKSDILYWITKWALGWLFFFLKYIDLLLIKRPRSKFLCLGVFFMGRKPQ